MKNKGRIIIKATALVLTATVCFCVLKFFHGELIRVLVGAAVLSAKSYIPCYEIVEDTQAADAFIGTEIKPTEEETTSEKATTEATTEKEEETTAAEKTKKLSDTDEDILKLMSSAKSNAGKDEKDGSISDYTYTKDGATDTFGSIRVKNTNETDIDIEAKLSEKCDLSINKDEPAVLIYHTHTTETYQLLSRDFYAVGFKSRSTDENRNMVRVGRAICEQIEEAGYKAIHVTDIHDQPYSEAYSRSRKTVEEYLKKYPSIQITLDIHRDAIQRSDGTKIAPTVEIDGKKAAQVMIISGCQEEGNGITNLPDWQYNLTFALKLQQSLENRFGGITRPLFFCARSYNMNVTHNSLLVEVGSDGNTLEEAVYTGKCIGTALADILKEYEK